MFKRGFWEIGIIGALLAFLILMIALWSFFGNKIDKVPEKKVEIQRVREDAVTHATFGYIKNRSY